MPHAAAAKLKLRHASQINHSFGWILRVRGNSLRVVLAQRLPNICAYFKTRSANAGPNPSLQLVGRHGHRLQQLGKHIVEKPTPAAMSCADNLTATVGYDNRHTVGALNYQPDTGLIGPHGISLWTETLLRACRIDVSAVAAMHLI
jgi:hypothetical protein